MALFDSYFDQGNYGGSGSLIDRLLSQLGTQSQYQPSQGFAGNPMDAQASVAGDQPSNPIAVGNYQMPRIGSGFADATPQPAPAPMPQPQMQPQMPLPPALETPSPLTRIFSPDGLIARLTGNDTRSQAQQNLRAQFEALVPLVGRQKAILAVLNPTAAQAIIGNEFGADKFGFQTLPDGTVIRTNQKTGEVAPAFQGGTKATFGVIGEQDGGGKQYGWIDPGKRTVTPIQGGAVQPGFVTGPDGKPIAIPPGVDPKTFRNEISKTNADAATGKMTEVQAKASTYAARMELAEHNLKTLENEGTGYWGRAMEGFPVIGGTAATNWAKTENYQKFAQAKDNFIAALLRQESGAAIGKSEYQAADKQYFPQPGDSADVIKQKAATRAAAVEQMKRAAGPGYKSPNLPEATAPSGAQKTKSGISWSVD